MKTILRGIGFTLLGWVAYLILICLAIIFSPFILLLIPVSAFMYASDPETIVKQLDGDA